MTTHPNVPIAGAPRALDILSREATAEPVKCDITTTLGGVGGSDEALGNRRSALHPGPIRKAVASAELRPGPAAAREPQDGPYLWDQLAVAGPLGATR
jgi:hypothetical protein